MPQAHFIQAMRDDGQIVLVRAAAIDMIEPTDTGMILHTPSGSVHAYGATMATIDQDMKSAQIVLVPLNRSAATPPPKPEPEVPQEPARQAVVRAPPVAVIDTPNEPTADEPELLNVPAVPRKPARKAGA